MATTIITRIKKTNDSQVFDLQVENGHRYILKVFYRFNRYRNELIYLEKVTDINTAQPIQNQHLILYDYIDETQYQYWSIVYPWSGVSLKMFSNHDAMDTKCLLLQIFNIAYELATQNISHNDIHKGNILIQSSKDLMLSDDDDDCYIRIRYAYQNDIAFEFTTRHVLKLIDFERSSTLKEGRRSFSSSSSSSSSSSPSRYHINFNQISFYCLQILQCTHLASNSIILPFLNANTLEKICNYFQEFRVPYQCANVTLLSESSNLPVHIDISNLFVLKKTTLPIDEMGVFLIDSKPIETDTFITNIGCTLFPQPRNDFGQFIQSSPSKPNCVVIQGKIFASRSIYPYEELFVFIS